LPGKLNANEADSSMLRQRRPSIDWFKVVVGAVIGLACLCAPRTLAQHAGMKTSGSNIVLADSDPVPDLSTIEVGIKPEAMRMYQRAVRELHSGQAQSAEKDAHRAIELDAKFADADALAATAALAQRQFSRARAEASDAAHIDTNDEKAWVILATADNYLGMYMDAADELDHVREQDRGTWQVAYQWARAEAGQDHAAQTLEWANRVTLTAPPGFAPLHLLRASALLAVSQYSQSVDELEIYLQLLDKNANGREELTRELHRLRELARNGAASQPTSDGMAEYNALAN
jgi:predicted Zn-dependent protease